MIELLSSYSDFIGIVGVTLVLTAYFLINTNKIDAKNVVYLLLNFFGATLILISLCFHWNLASVVIEFAWISISCIGLYRVYKSNKDQGYEPQN